MSFDLDFETMPILNDEYPKELDQSGVLEITLDEADEFFRMSLPDKVDYGQMVGAEPWTWGSCFVYEDQDSYFHEYAIRCIQEMQLLKQLYSTDRMLFLPVKIGDSVWLIRDRQVEEHKIVEVRILQGHILCDLENHDSVDISSIDESWWTTKDRAEVELSVSELKRLGLM